MKIGVHRARALSAVLSETKNRREYVYIKLALVEDKNDAIGWSGYFGDDVGKDGKTQTERTVAVLRCCGWEGDDLTDLSTIDRHEVEIVVNNEEYQGAMQMRCSYVQPIGTAAAYMPKSLPTTQAQRFSDRIKGRLRGEKPSYGYPPPRSDAPPDDGVPPPVDDDIPF